MKEIMTEERILRIGDIRIEHLNKKIRMTGELSTLYRIKPKLVEAVFECPYCDFLIRREQVGETIYFPNECPKYEGGCGRKLPKNLNISLKESKFKNSQIIALQDYSQPYYRNEIEIELIDDLCLQEEHLYGKFLIEGTVRTHPLKTKTTTYDFYIEANSIEEISEEDYQKNRESKEDHQKMIIRRIIKELEKEYGEEVPTEEVLDLAEEERMEREKAEEMIEAMKKDAILYSPGSGVIKFVR